MTWSSPRGTWTRSGTRSSSSTRAAGSSPRWRTRSSPGEDRRSTSRAAPGIPTCGSTRLGSRRSREQLGAALERPAAGAALFDELLALDAELRSGLERCERRVVVTSHAAFGRLAARYGLAELSLAGRSPEAEPGPRELERLVHQVSRLRGDHRLLGAARLDRLAKTVAREAGVAVAVLDPVEGLSEERLEAGEDYLTVMRDNLDTLRTALGCR